MKKIISKPWVWPVPAFLISIFLLIASKKIWLIEESINGKTGAVEKNIPAHILIIVWLILSAIYSLSYIPFFRDFIEAMTYNSRFISQSSHEAEGGCAVILLRFAALATIYLITFSFLWTYLLH